MEEKLRPGVFSSYTAGSSGYGSGSRAAGLIVPGVTAPGTPVWVTDGTEAAAALPAPEEAAALAACELLLATGAGKVWLCPVAEEGWQAAFDLAGAEAELDTIVSACEEEADALAFGRRSPPPPTTAGNGWASSPPLTTKLPWPWQRL